MFGLSAFSQVPYSSLGTIIKTGSGSINAVGTVVADALRVRTSSGSISALLQ
jgi:hypothetical protein